MTDSSAADAFEPDTCAPLVFSHLRRDILRRRLQRLVSRLARTRLTGEVADKTANPCEYPLADGALATPEVTFAGGLTNYPCSTRGQAGAQVLARYRRLMEAARASAA